MRLSWVSLAFVVAIPLTACASSVESDAASTEDGLTGPATSKPSMHYCINGMTLVHRNALGLINLHCTAEISVEVPEEVAYLAARDEKTCRRLFAANLAEEKRICLEQFTSTRYATHQGYTATEMSERMVR